MKKKINTKDSPVFQGRVAGGKKYWSCPGCETLNTGEHCIVCGMMQPNTQTGRKDRRPNVLIVIPALLLMGILFSLILMLFQQKQAPQQLAATQATLATTAMPAHSQTDSSTSTTPVETISSEEFSYEPGPDGVYPVQITLSEDGMDVLGKNLSVQIRDQREVLVTLSGLTIRDSYITNRSDSEKDTLEYGWSVELAGDEEIYSVSTSNWVLQPGQNVEKSLSEMQSSLWFVQGDTSYWINDIVMHHTAESITWSCVVPQEYAFRYQDFKTFRVNIWDSDIFYELRTYQAS